MDIHALPSRPFTLRSALELGLSRTQLRRAAAAGAVERLFHGVYVRGDIPVTTEVRVAAAALVINPGAVVCDRTAAWIWSVDVFEFRELDGVPPVEAFLPSGCRRTERSEVRGGERDLRPCDWVEVGGVKVTTPLRTAMDLGCRLNRRQALAAMDALMRLHGFVRADMERATPRYFRRRGSVQLRELVPLVDPRAESQPESWTRLELFDAGLHTPEPQWWIVVDGVETYRIDLAYPHAKVAVEYNGEEWHTRPGDRARDEERREWLEKHGWTVVVVDKTDFAPDASMEWVRQVRAALAHARRPAHRRYVRG
jgi:REase_MTES_1575/Transcriptional regulator, AbiEi antitoxin